MSFKAVYDISSTSRDFNIEYALSGHVPRRRKSGALVRQIVFLTQACSSAALNGMSNHRQESMKLLGSLRSPVPLFLMPRLERIMQPSRIYLRYIGLILTIFFSCIITYRHTILNYPPFTILGNEVKRTKLYAITTNLTVINIYLYSDFYTFDLRETQ